MSITLSCCFMFNFVFLADFLNDSMGFCCCLYFGQFIVEFPKALSSSENSNYSSFKVKAMSEPGKKKKPLKSSNECCFYSLKDRNTSKSISTKVL